MAMYLLLRFEDDDEARNFATLTSIEGSTIIPAGMYKAPTMFCECPDPGDRSVLGLKYNWRVHKDCGRPKKGVWQNPRNLLRPEEKLVQRKIMITSVEPQPPRPLS
jgi:hypothetical protein